MYQSHRNDPVTIDMKPLIREVITRKVVQTVGQDKHVTDLAVLITNAKDLIHIPAFHHLRIIVIEIMDNVQRISESNTAFHLCYRNDDRSKCYIIVFYSSSGIKEDRDWNRPYPRSNRDSIAPIGQQRYSNHYPNLGGNFGPSNIYPCSETPTAFPRDRFSPGEWRPERDYRRDYDRDYERRHPPSS